MKHRSPTMCRSSKLFLTPKASSAIPILGELSQNYLRQAALDAAVSRIEYVGVVAFGRFRYALDSILVVRDGERLVVDLIDRSPLRTLDDEGLRLISLEKIGARLLPLTDAMIMSSPRFSNAGRIWEERRGKVTLAVRDRIFAQLEHERVTSIETLGRKFAPDVFELACEAEIEIDLSAANVMEAAIKACHPHLKPRRPAFQL